MRRILSVGGAVVVAGVLALSGTAVADTPPPGSADNTTTSTSLGSSARVPVIVTLKAEANATEAREDALLVQQAQLLTTWKDKYGIEVDRQFGLLLSGFSATMPSNKISGLKREAAVASVREQRMFYPALENAGDLVQATDVWNDLGVDGSGMVIAIIDSGIDPTHRDMRLDDPSLAAITEVKAGGIYTDKVPWGYNYADRNDDIVDQDPTQHGMHVAGIAAANGGPSASIAGDGRVNGMAPEAQLLAMKVFSNDVARRNQAFEADIVAAVEDSVRQGADIINMSLGSANGFDSADYGLNKAIENASEQGVLVVVAAGNEGLRSSLDSTDWDLDLYKDNGTVGGPSTTKSALSVASIENETVISPLATVSSVGISSSAAYELQAGTLPTSEVELWDGGLGTWADFHNDEGEVLPEVAGKYALIERGEIDFSEKVNNAGDAGAAGVVLWNSEAGGDSTFGIILETSYTFPVVTVGRALGTTASGALQVPQPTYIEFATDPVAMPNADSLTPSSFTSWGVSPDLAFKPEIAGIGGNVYSTLNNDKYGNMSGTSMASPQVAGVSTLVVSALRDRFPQMDRGEINDLARVVLSNTAQRAVNEDGVPYPTRQQGAGLAQAADALATDVAITSDGAPNIALRDFTEAKEFSVTLKNLGDTDQQFQIDIPAVLTEATDAEETLVAVESSHGDSLTASEGTVEVPAGSEVSVDFTLSVGNSDQARFVEGWIDFVAQDPDQVDLTIPYMGFVGDWGAEEIFDTGLWGEVFEDPTLKTQLGIDDGYDIMAYDPDSWFTADSAGTKQILLPAVFALRNATEMQYELLDSAGSVIQQLGYDREVPAPLISRIYNGQASAYTIPDWGFDGLRYDKTAGDFTALESGEYGIRIKGRVNDSKEMQSLEFPFKLDSDAPQVEIADVTRQDGIVTMRVQVTDEHSGPAVKDQWGDIVGFQVSTGSGFVLPEIISNDGYQAEVELKFNNPADQKWAVLRASDNAGNVSEPLTYFFDDNAVRWLNAGDFEPGFTDGSFSMYAGESLIQDGKVPFFFAAGSGVKTMKVADQSADIDANGEAVVWIPFEVGHRLVSIQGLSGSGAVLYETEMDLFYHPTLPTVSNMSARPVQADVWGSGTLIDALEVTGCVSDELIPLDQMIVWVFGWDAFPDTSGCFTVVVPDEDPTYGGTPGMVLYLVDNGINAIAGYIPIEGRQPNPTWSNLLKLSNVELAGGIDFVNHWSPDLTENEDGSATFNITGRFNTMPGVFKIDGQPVAINADLSFSHPVALNAGVTSVNVYLESPDGTLVNDTSLRLLYSPSLPELSLSAPVFFDGQLFVPQATDNQVQFTGEIADQTFGHTLWINGDVVSSYTDITAPGEELTRKSFEYASVLNAGDIITINVLDAISREEQIQVPVVLDDVAPVLALNLNDGDLVTEPLEVSLSAFDKTLVGFTAGIVDLAANDATGTPVELTQSSDGDGVTIAGSFDPYELGTGRYALVMHAVDAAGNVTEQTVNFFVLDQATVTIEGPSAIEVEEGQTINLTDHWTVPDGYQMTADLSALVVGDNAVRIQVLDGQGSPIAQKDVVITVIRGLSTLTDGRVSITARFNPEDALTATWTSVSSAVEEFHVDHGGEVLGGTFVVEVPKTAGVKVIRVADSTARSRALLETEVTVEAGDGTLTFDATTPGTYRIIYPEAPVIDGGKEPGPAGPGSKDKGPGGISATGANGVQGSAIAAIALVAAGAGALYLSRKRGSSRGGRATEA